MVATWQRLQNFQQIECMSLHLFFIEIFTLFIHEPATGDGWQMHSQVLLQHLQSSARSASSWLSITTNSCWFAMECLRILTYVMQDVAAAAVAAAAENMTHASAKSPAMYLGLVC